jgi:hypothetical protein
MTWVSRSSLTALTPEGRGNLLRQRIVEIVGDVNLSPQLAEPARAGAASEGDEPGLPACPHG